MKKLLLSALSFLSAWVLLTAFSTELFAQSQGTYVVDTNSSLVSWEGKTIAGSGHTGYIQLSSGSLDVVSGKVTSGKFVVDVKSIKTTDLKGDRAARLENHLKNEDFFDVSKFPTASLVITSVQSKSNNEVQVTGDLTIKNIKKSISFPAKITINGDKLTAVAESIKINRTEFDVKYRSGSFFSGLGDRAILDEFELKIELVAQKK